MDAVNENGIPISQIVSFFAYHQDLYKAGVPGVWGFANRMRDYLFHGRRRIPLTMIRDRDKDGVAVIR